MVAEQGETVLNHILDVASEQAWDQPATGRECHGQSHQQVVVNLAKLQEAKVMESLVGTVAAEGSWDEFLP